MIGEHAYGELIEACLAINLAYLALERFRYRESIVRIIERAESHVEGMPKDARIDLAYENWTTVRAGRGPGANHPLLHFVYLRVLDNGADRKITTVAATLAFMTLVYRVIFPEPSVLGHYAEWPLLIFMVLVTGSAALMISLGRRCVHSVAKTVIENVGHLGTQYLKENKPAFESMNLFIREIRETHIGPQHKNGVEN